VSTPPVNARLCLVLVFVFVFALLAAVGTRAASGADGFRIIVNPDNPVRSLDRRFLADVYLKRSTRWPSDEAIRPVDLDPGSPIRRAFSDDVLNRSVSAIKSYWQQMVFSGRGVPPPELDSDGEVVRFVLKNRGAIGYVSGGSDLAGAKTVFVR
jgi:ABC-type phosphate transport system substrate-binding protein